MSATTKAIATDQRVETKFERRLESEAKDRRRPSGEQRLERLGDDVQRDAIDQVEANHRRRRRERLFARVMQVMDFAFGVLYVLIAFEIALELMAARDSSAFKQFLDALTAPFLAPFERLLPEVKSGGSELKLSYGVAIAVYALIHFGVHKLLLNVSRPRQELAPSVGA